MRDYIIEQLSQLNIINKEKLIEYVDFCIKNDMKKRIKGETEHHHILPKSKNLPFEQYKNLNDNPWNGVHLKFEDHYMAHLLLAEASDNQFIIYAWWNMNSINKNKFDNSDLSVIISPERYKQLREKHSKNLSLSSKLRNKSEKLIKNRLKTMNKIGEDGLTTFERQGKKISKTLKENGTVLGDLNGMYGKTIFKERNNPLSRISSVKNPDETKYVQFNTRYLELYDNQGVLYFSGWKDECIEFCKSINLDYRKITTKDCQLFVYKGSLHEYTVELMIKMGLSRYINSTLVVIKDKDVQQRLNEIKGGLST